MSSFRKAEESYSRLTAALGTLLERQEPRLQLLSDGEFPLLVLEVGSDLAGFAIIDGSPEQLYSQAYDAFKELYRQRHDIWKERDLSFVVCRSPLEPAYDAFFSSVETDVFFCRKYVLYLSLDEAEQERELLRLPFVPLPQSRESGSIRPPSAQTLLQGLGVDTELANHIVVTGARSADRIVSEVLVSHMDLPSIPAIGDRVEPEILRQALPTERTRISKVVIEAFRAYRRRQEFDVDADVVVLYGPNGLGKTSFFDALDYACTGRIGRLCLHRITPERFTDLARHLESAASDGSVCLQVDQGTVRSTVKREVGNWSDALIDGKKHNRASVLQLLTSARWGTKKARIENLERLFRATHLFSQSTPELLVEFEQDSTLSFELVSRMLALDDYASGLAKADAVLVRLGRQISDAMREIGALTGRANEVQSRIGELPDPRDEVRAGQQIRQAANELVEELREYIGFTIDKTEPTAKSVREWRAMVVSTAKDAQDSLRRLQAAESGFPQFKKDRTALEQMRTDYLKAEIVLKEKADAQELLHKELSKLADHLARERGMLAEAESRLRTLSTFRDLREVYQKSNTSARTWEQELKRVAGETGAITDALHPLLANVESLRSRVAEQKEEEQAHALQMQSLSAIQEELPSWNKNRKNLTSLQQAIATAQTAILAADENVKSLEVTITEKEKELAACEQEYEKLAADQLELTGLLDKIEAHVSDGICPTCGADHNSKSALTKLIHAQKQARPAYVEELAKRIGNLRKPLKEDKASLAVLTNERASNTRKLKESRDEQLRVQTLATAFEHRLREAGLSVEEEIPNTLGNRLVEQRKIYESARTAQLKLRSELDDALKRISTLERRREELASTRKHAEAAATPLKNQIASLRTSAEKLELSLDIELDDLAALAGAAASREAAARKQVHKLAPQLEALTQAVNAGDEQLEELKRKALARRAEIARLESKLELYMESTSGVLDRESLALDAMSASKKLAEERVDRLQLLERRCLTLERTLDAVQRSAMRAELEAQAQLLAEEKQALVESSEWMSTVKTWFESVKDVLDRQSSQSVANHVDSLGPLTTLIQKRLRVVYGFGDVSLRARGKEIRVMVGWKDEYVRPADYFSDSQQQILMLGLFLAGRLTQTWSGFAPILMDDPVTHFDDLNAFGFVELIRGLATTSPNQRQFFISTCDDRLFELMRAKFSGLDGGARFFRFEGFGHDGPVVERLD